MRRAKIVCTLGPASSDPITIEKLIAAGMNVARLNFSHGTQEQHRALCERVRSAAAKLGANIAVLQDLQGPRIRIGAFAEGTVTLAAGQRFVVTVNEVPGDSTRVSTTYADLSKDVSPGDTLLLDDGMIRLRVLETTGSDVVCEVVEGGPLTSHKGINLPGVAVSSPALTAKDAADLAFGVKLGVDWVALSFVRRPDDVHQAKAELRRLGASVPVIAKLEKPEALEDLEAIIAAADGIMVARGDLGVELSPEQVPVAQKRIIRAANEAKTPVITATQMLESMTHHSRPTRAEASDVANAIYDGTDAVMLSGETAVGRYPVKTVATMDRIIRTAEADYLPMLTRRWTQNASPGFPEAVAEAAASAAEDIRAKAVVGFTQSGGTARLLSKYRPAASLIVFAHEESIRRRLAILWGVDGRLIQPIADTEQLFAAVERKLLADGTVQPDDPIVLVAGSPIGAKGSTNFMLLHRISAR